MVTLDMVYFEKNMSLLKKNYPELYVRVFNAQEPFDGTDLVFAKNKKPNLKVSTPGNDIVFIHDHDDPGSESESFLLNVPKDSTGAVVMYGMGLGYAVFDLVRKCKNLQTIIVFELNVEFFRYALKCMDFKELIRDKRIIFSIGEPEDVSVVLAPAIRALMLEDIHILNVPSCLKINPGYEKFSSLVFDEINVLNIEGATKSVHGKVFFENRLKHLTSMHHDSKLEDLAGRFKGIPALIIAAGPSLDKNIDQIHKAVGKAIIICVDTALPILLKKGIIPDFVSSIDYSELTYEKIADVASNPSCKDINLICTSYVGTAVTKTFPAQTVFWAFGGTALENWINKLLGGGMAVGGAGTVAHLNFLSATIMGCDPLIFVGQDLARSEGNAHSSDVVLTGTEPLDKIIKNAVWVKGVNEPQVPTTRSMHGYRVIFENWIKQSESKVINATEGGAWIEGADHMTLQTAIDEFCKDTVGVDIDIKPLKFDPKNSMIAISREILTLERIIEKASSLGAEVLKKVCKLMEKSKFLTSLAMLPKNIQKKIIALDGLHSKADENPLWPMFDEMTMEGMRDNEREKQEIGRLENIPVQYLAWLEKSVRRINRVNDIRQDNLSYFKKQVHDLVSYYSNELKLLTKIKKNDSTRVEVLELARLYYESENYNLLEKLLNRHKQDKARCPWINFYYGIISLHHFEYKKADQFFQWALAVDPSVKEKIENKRRELADFYFRRAMNRFPSVPFPFESVIGIENKIGNYLRLKGLNCFPAHGGLRKDFIQLAQKDLQKIQNAVQDGNMGKLSEYTTLLKTWVDLFCNEKALQSCIPGQIISAFFRFYGKILLDEKKLQKVLDMYLSALDIMPDNPDIHIAVTDVYFSLEDFDSGLKYLKKAVALDKHYAHYWNNIGNNLQAKEDYYGALFAYEQYLLALPDNFNVLKQIGDCNLKLGDMGAAREAYEQLKNKLEK